MAQATLIATGDLIDYTPSTAKSAGDVVVLGTNLVGIVNRAIAANTLGALAMEGVFDIAKITGAINDGDSVYWDADGNPVSGTAGTGAATTTATGNTYLGACIVDAASGDATVRVLKTKQPAVTANNSLQNAIADPGDAGAIPVTASGYVPIVTAGSETRTLAAPSFVGQQLALYVKTDGGTCVITVASAINTTGNTVITMADAPDFIVLHAIESGSNKVWRVLANDGAVLSTP